MMKIGAGAADQLVLWIAQLDQSESLKAEMRVQDVHVPDDDTTHLRIILRSI